MKITHLSQILLSVYLARLLIFGATIGDSIAVCGLAALYGFWLYLETIKKPDPNLELNETVRKLDQRIALQESKMAAFALTRR